MTSELDIPTHDIPFDVTARPDTGLSNVQLGTVLFVVSQAMLFAGMVAAYVLLRVAAEGHWRPADAALDPWLAWPAALCLAVSGLAWWASARRAAGPGWTEGDSGRRRQLLVAVVSGCLFLILMIIQGLRLMSAGQIPAAHNFYALAFALGALHGLHALLALFYAGWLYRDHEAWTRRDVKLEGRLRACGLVWMLVVVVGFVQLLLVYAL